MRVPAVFALLSAVAAAEDVAKSSATHEVCAYATCPTDDKKEGEGEVCVDIADSFKIGETTYLAAKPSEEAMKMSEKCPAYYTWDAEAKKLSYFAAGTYTGHTCTDGATVSTTDATKCECKVSGKQLNAAGTACEDKPALTCPSPQVLDKAGTACIDIPTCKEGEHLNAAKNECVANFVCGIDGANEFIDEDDDDTCKCYVHASGNPTTDSTKGTCVCPAETSFSNHSFATCEKVKTQEDCDSETLLNPKTNKCEALRRLAEAASSVCTYPEPVVVDEKSECKGDLKVIIRTNPDGDFAAPVAVGACAIAVAAAALRM